MPSYIRMNEAPPQEKRGPKGRGTVQPTLLERCKRRIEKDRGALIHMVRSTCVRDRESRARSLVEEIVLDEGRGAQSERLDDGLSPASGWSVTTGFGASGGGKREGGFTARGGGGDGGGGGGAGGSSEGMSIEPCTSTEEGSGLSGRGRGDEGGWYSEDSLDEEEREELLLKLESILMQEAELENWRTEAQRVDDEEKKKILYYAGWCGEN